MPQADLSPVIPKKEHSQEPSIDSPGSPAAAGSEPASDLQASALGLDAPTSPPPPEAQVPKRKGGRKPIYATSEERKQRNRQAQAAFRERRTEYIKQLETTIKHQEETLQKLQQSHRSAADECLMLRYKNSLLERILLEKSVDVQEELNKKEISIPTKVPPSLPQPTPIQRAAMNRRHQYSRSASGSISLVHSPSTQDSSPASAPSPNYGPHMRTSSMGFKVPPPPLRVNPNGNLSSPSTATPLSAIAPSPLSQPSSAGIARSTHWPSPYETHMQQLEQEYDAHADMMDDQDADEPSSGPGPYPQEFGPPHAGMPGAPGSSHVSSSLSPTSDGTVPVPMAGFDPYDPMLDADPFGLTASMHFPTQFTYQENSMRK